jgi:hypothetical protein
MATELLELDEITSTQASKYATHNEALRQIEGRIIRALSRSSSGPPSSPTPANGHTYIVDSATGDWSAASVDDIAHYYGGAWTFYTPIEGIRIWVNDEDSVVKYDGANWVGPRNPILSKDVSHGSPIADITLTTPESENDILEFTGTLLANINIYVSAIEKQWTVYNNTSGAYTLTVRINSSPEDTGITIGQGNRAIIYSDGANVNRITADV